MKKVYGYLLVSAILLVIVFGWKGLLVVGLLSPIVGFACYLESDPSPKADQDTDTASLAATSLGKENDCRGDNPDGAEGNCDTDCDAVLSTSAKRLCAGMWTLHPSHPCDWQSLHGKNPCPKKCRFCRNNRKTTQSGGRKMIIAVTSENGEVFQHFGHTPEFTIYETKGDELLGPRVIPTGENGHGALAGILDALGVEVLICGGIGGGAQMALDEIGVKVVGGASGNVDEVVKGFIAGTLNTRSDFSCHYHEHDANHRCGDHGCGEHNCHQHHGK